MSSIVTKTMFVGVDCDDFLASENCAWKCSLMFIFLACRKDLLAAQREQKRKKNEKKRMRVKELEEQKEKEKNKWLNFNAKVRHCSISHSADFRA